MKHFKFIATLIVILAMFYFKSGNSEKFPRTLSFRGPNEPIAVQTEYKIGVEAIQPDLDLLQEHWEHNPNETRPAVIKFYLDSWNECLQIRIKCHSELFIGGLLRKQLFSIDNPDDNRTSIFYMGRQFYAFEQDEYVFRTIHSENLKVSLSEDCTTDLLNTIVIAHPSLKLIAQYLRTSPRFSAAVNHYLKGNLYRKYVCSINSKDRFNVVRTTNILFSCGNGSSERFCQEYHIEPSYRSRIRFDIKTETFHTDYEMNVNNFFGSPTFSLQYQCANKIYPIMTIQGSNIQGDDVTLA